VLDVRQGDGTYATSLAPSLLLEALSFIVDFHRDDTVLDFLEVRRILEPGATALAATRMTDEDRVELGKVLESVDVDTPVEELLAADLEFHRLIAVGAGKPRARVAGRQHVRADHPGADLAWHDRASSVGTNPGRTSRDLPRHRCEGR